MFYRQLITSISESNVCMNYTQISSKLFLLDIQMENNAHIEHNAMRNRVVVGSKIP